jgi:hypothetical protein
LRFRELSHVFSLMPFLWLAVAARGDVEMPMFIYTAGSTNGNIYQAWPDLMNYPLPTPQFAFQTAEITSADGVYDVLLDASGGHGKFPAPFTQADDLLASINQAWTIVIDKGLPTEKTYTTTYNLGTLPTMELTPSVITWPADRSSISTINPTFAFKTPLTLGPITARLEHVVYTDDPVLGRIGNGVIDQTWTLAAGATSLTPDFPLMPSTDYMFEMYLNNIVPAGAGFSTPVDLAGNPISGFYSPTWVQMDASNLFTTPAPEPSMILLLPVLFLSRRSGRENSPSE